MDVDGNDGGEYDDPHLEYASEEVYEDECPFDSIGDEEEGWIPSDLARQLVLVTDEIDSIGPTPSLWDDVEAAVPTITIDKARREAWNQGKVECQHIREKLKHRMESLLGRRNNKQQSESLQHFAFFKLFGPETSRIGQHFCQKLDINSETFCKFMATFLVSCQYQKPVSKLHSSKHFDSSKLMELDAYLELWRTIANTGKSNTIDEAPFWMDIEENVHKDLAEFFLPSDMENTSVLVALDDDKMHFNVTKQTNCMGLKQQRHIKDNRMGFTAHTSALAAMDVPIRVDMERERDTSHICYVRQMKKLFGGNCGDGIPNLGNVTVASDRGYWSVPLTFGFLLRAGANIIGTVKRSPWFPFTYDRNGGGDKPTCINPKGAKNSYYKKLQL